MDPLTNLQVGTPVTPEEGGEDVLFARPQRLMPTNPFANLETRFDLAISENSAQVKNSFASPNRFTAFSENDESEIEFDQRFERAKRLSQVTNPEVKSQPVTDSLRKGQRSSSFGFESDEDRLDIAKLAKSLQESSERKPTSWTRTNQRRKSSDCLNISTQNSTGVRTEDVIFTSVIFLTYLLSFVTDVTLIFWYYLDEGAGYNFKWCSALTFCLLVLGSLGILSQFNQAEKDRLDRLFHHGRRVQIVVNCFPPLGTILCSYYSFRSALKAKDEQVYSVHFFAIEEFAQSLTRVQSFLQAAPQATLQLLILLETWTDLTLAKGLLTFASVTLSLMVMTSANLPGRSDMVATSVRKGIYSPVSRIFLGLRLISSFCSRTMALTYFLVSLRCVFGSRPSVVLGVTAITLPRLTFTLIDYCYHLTRVRRGPDSISRHFGRLSFSGTLSGYMATIFFPMSHPVWVFWFIWVETVTLMTIGFVVTLTSTSASPTCVSITFNFIYTGLFILFFVIIPFVLPYARATIKKQHTQKIAKIFSEQDRRVANLQETQSPTQATISI